MDEIVKAITEDGEVLMTAVSTAGLTERARRIHGLSPVAAAAFGRVLAAASMIGRSLKGENASVTVRVQGGGPIGAITVVSDSSGNVRGYVKNPRAESQRRPDGKLDVGAAVGRDGTLTVIKDLNLKEPYVGSIRLVSGEIAEDFARYFLESEQTPSAVALGVLVGQGGEVLAAGGYIVQPMPGAPDGIVDALERNVARTGAVTAVLKDGGAESLVESVLSGMNPRILERGPIEYRCYCSRERVLDAIAGIDPEELEDMRRKSEPVEVTCRFCDKVYTISPDELQGYRGDA